MGDEIRDAIVRRALGYESDEIVEEYGFSEGEAVLVKRKVTKNRCRPISRRQKCCGRKSPCARIPTRSSRAKRSGF